MRKAKLLLEGEAEGKLLVWQILTNRKLSRYFQREVILQQACIRPYISHLLFYNKLPKELATFKAISAGQEPGLGLAGCLWLRASHKAAVKFLAKAAVSPQGSKKGRFATKLTHMAIGRPWVLIACWQKIPFPGFPGGAVVGSLPANAGDTGSSPGLGGSHMPRSNWTREPQLLSLRDWSLCSATREAAIVRGPRTAMKSGPRLPQLEKALAQKRRPNTAKNK